MRYAIIAALAIVLAIPSIAEARSKSRVNFFFSFGTGHSRFVHRPYYAPVFSHYHYRPAYRYSSGYYGRYAVPRVYSPYRYTPTYTYGRDYLYRRGVHAAPRLHYDQRYYGPAVERYHYDRQRFPSYHYDRRESYLRSGTFDRGYRY